MEGESFNGDRTEISIEGLTYAFSANSGHEWVSLVVSADTDLTVIRGDLRAHRFVHLYTDKSMLDGAQVIVVTADRAIGK